MNGNTLIESEEIQNRIYTIRGLQIMLDRDLATFYGVKPIRLREQVKRNIKRFPADFMFQLTEEEVDFMVSQNAIPSKQLALDLIKFNEQYPAIEIKEFKNSHDRFLIIDNKYVYHFGASLKDLGKKWFAFSKMDIGVGEMLKRLEGMGRG